MLVSDDDVNNYNKIKSNLDKLRLLVEQSELWIFKKKENSKDSNEETAIHTSVLLNKSIIEEKVVANLTNDNEMIGDPFVLQELDYGPELEQSAIIKYKE